ncbi:MAG: helicase C-terminal domain-containing protein, partial [bacterium]
MKLRDVFSEQGLISRVLDNFEFRPQQMIMAEAVEGAVSLRRHLLAEVGTGVGKSLAYLVPFIQWAKDKDKKVVVSTYTKTLQEQLVKKDLPFLKSILGIDFNFALCVGGQNYLCLRRFSQGYKNDLFESDRELDEIGRIRVWAETTETGLYSDLDFEPRDGTWNKICRETDLCMGRKCQYKKECFYNKARSFQNQADILVVNHHLFFANLSSGGRVLPSFEGVVFDEAHTLQDVATSYLGVEINNFRIKYFLDTIFNPKSKKGYLKRIRQINNSKADRVNTSMMRMRTAGDMFFRELVEKFGNETKLQRVRDKNIIFNHIKEPMGELLSCLESVLHDVQELEDRIQIKSFITRGRGINSAIDIILNQSLGDIAQSDEDQKEKIEGSSYGVYWVEIISRARRPRYSLYGAPVDISREFKTMVLDVIAPVVFTSATLSTNSNFDFIRKILGIESADEILLSSPFDYSYQALVYTPSHMSDPTVDFGLYQQDVIREIKDILDVMRGRTFILFTNYRMLDAISAILKEELVEFNILRQGDAPRYRLLEEFKSKENSVLLGTTTFWQGVDVPGRALECVIITKLPFAVPDDPVVEARMELLREQGKNPFLEYQLPQAVIMMRQGFGRLIRRNTDIGMVAILDPRIKTRFYGRSFVEA